MARPNLSYLKNAVLAVVGVPCGVLTGLTGMTNSYLVAPLLHWLIGLRDTRLIGSALTIASFSSLTGILAYTQHRALDWPLTIGVAIGFLFGASLGQRIGAMSPSIIVTGRVIGAVAGVLLAALMIANAYGLVRFHVLAGDAFASPWSLAWSIGLGAAAGLAGRLFDLAGLLIVPALYYIAGTTMLASQACAMAILLANSIPAALIYARRSLIEPRSAVWMSFGALFGALGGSQAAAMHHHNREMLVVYAVALVAVIVVRQLSVPVAPRPGESAH
ncbi:MAG: sulfite exporter TauE/SafE family protein [Capsulimonadaceae bacterium]|nr:sulfite exporter TauE/SafE family protein [Capsulimonadaceae bacterium]